MFDVMQKIPKYQSFTKGQRKRFEILIHVNYIMQIKYYYTMYNVQI